MRGWPPMGPWWPHATREIVDRKKAELIAVQVEPFAGLVKATGRTRSVTYLAGKRISEKDLNSMNFLVQGIICHIPK